MPLKLNIGLSRKLGEPNYGSRGASVNMELEVDTSLAGEPDRLQDRIRRMFTLVRNSLEEELHSGSGQATPPNGRAPSNGNGASNGHGNGQEANGNGHGNGNAIGHAAPDQQSGGRAATASQIKAMYAIAKSQGLNLFSLVRSRFQTDKPEALSLRQASSVIDEMKKGGDH